MLEFTGVAFREPGRRSVETFPLFVRGSESTYPEHISVRPELSNSSIVLCDKRGVSGCRVCPGWVATGGFFRDGAPLARRGVELVFDVLMSDID